MSFMALLVLVSGFRGVDDDPIDELFDDERDAGDVEAAHPPGEQREPLLGGAAGSSAVACGEDPRPEAATPVCDKDGAVDLSADLMEILNAAGYAPPSVRPLIAIDTPQPDAPQHLPNSHMGFRQCASRWFVPLPLHERC